MKEGVGGGGFVVNGGFQFLVVSPWVDTEGKCRPSRVFLGQPIDQSIFGLPQHLMGNFLSASASISGTFILL